jgi:hypothetical protein
LPDLRVRFAEHLNQGGGEVVKPLTPKGRPRIRLPSESHPVINSIVLLFPCERCSSRLLAHLFDSLVITAQ